MSETEEDPAFTHVWVKDEPDMELEQEPVDFLADVVDEGEKADDNEIGSGVEIDPMSIVKSETLLDDDDDDHRGEDDEENESLIKLVNPQSIVKDEFRVYHESKGKTADPPWTPLGGPVKIRRGVKLYQCPFCSYKAKLHVLRNHVRKHTDTKEFHCPFCEFNTNYDTALRRHINLLHSGDSDEEKPKKTYVKKYKCTLCPYITAHRHGLRSHMQGKHQDEKNHKCTFCPYETKYSTALHRHRFTQHKEEVSRLGEASRVYKCSSCDFTALMRSVLQQHERKHLFKHKCHLCRYKCETGAELQQHVTENHWKTGDQMKKPTAVKSETDDAKTMVSSTDPIFKCRICENESVTYVAFLAHVKSHDKVDPYKCNVCGYETACNATFLNHLQLNHGVTDDATNDIKVISEGIMSAMQAISMGVAPEDSDDEPLASRRPPDDDWLDSCDTTNSNEKPTKKRAYNGTFSCDLCPYTSKYKSALKSHMARHTDEKAYKCSQCPYSSKYRTSYRRHKMLKHGCDSGKGQYLCSECSYRTFYKTNLTLHMNKHNGDKRYKCAECSFGTVYKTAFLRHGKIHERRRAAADGGSAHYQCDMCPYSTQYEGRFSWHMLKTHNKRGTLERGVKCERCDFETNVKLKFRMTAHLQRSKQPCAMKCLHCDFQTHYKCEIKHHRRQHYPEPVELPAPAGDATPDAPQNLTTTTSHFKEESEPPPLEESHIAWKKIPVLENRALAKPFACYKCSYSSRFKSSVQRHFQRFHAAAVKPYRCSHCDFGTSTKDSIALHTKRSKQGEPMSCDVCQQFSTVYKCEFVTHQKLHNPYRCSKCTYSSKSKYDLERHYTMHTNKGYKCRYCSYVAARRDTLMTHEITHTGVRPYQCHLCPYGAMRLTFLEKHIMQRHNAGDNVRSKPFQCHACPYGSYSRLVLDRHIAQRHGEDAPAQPAVSPPAPPPPASPTPPPSPPPPPAQKQPPEKGAKPFQCTACPYSAFSPKVLKKHMSIHEPTQTPLTLEESQASVVEKPFQCHLCPYSSFRPNILKNHLILKHSCAPPADFVSEYTTAPAEKTYRCHLCTYSSMSVNVLNKHLALKHDSEPATALDSTVKTFRCHHCPFNSLNSNVLKRHVMQSHSQLSQSQAQAVKPYRCHVCPYNTFSPKVLNKHLSQKHPGVNTYGEADLRMEMISVHSDND